MFSFFHRTPEIHLDCFTYNHNTFLNTPIVYASKTIPDWWKELPTHKPVFGEDENNKHVFLNKNTIKDCYAIIELYKKGIVIENWTDISIKSDEKELNYCWSSGIPPESHVREQLGSAYPNYHHIKLNSPWRFVEKSGVKFLWFGAEWSLDKMNLKVLPGVLNFDIISGVNVNIMLPKNESEIFIPIGQPLVHLIPISEKKLIFKNHLVDKNEYDKIHIISSFASFYGWRKVLQLRKRNKERGTCPFGFGDK
jgi:hypothetical protein